MNEQDWHCKDCKKLIEKFKKNTTVKEFVWMSQGNFVNDFGMC